MENIADKELIKSIDALDLVLGTIMKPLVEAGASKVVGNGNFVSGVAKLGLAYGVVKYGPSGRVVKGVAIGAGMDGAEDIIVAAKSKLGGATTNATSAGVF